ncbi:MAG: ABC transporter permease [Chloracidobacterium sp.]|nr:ABC transporter permease [Chloracidobacterium sp.]
MQDIEEELRVHVEMETETNIERGMPPEVARASAMKSFGNPVRKTELSYDVRGGGWLEGLWQDLRYGVRMLKRNPGFTFIAVVTLALGIGANTAIFSVVNAVLLKPLPFAEADRLFVVQEDHDGGCLSYPNFLDLKAQASAFETVAIFNSVFATMSGDGIAPIRLPVGVGSANLFTALGAVPKLGRGFLPEEDQRGGGPAGRPVILSHNFWRDHLGGNPNALGRMMTLDGLPFTIVGVMPAGFRFPIQAESVAVWTTVAMDAEPTLHGGAIPTSRSFPYYKGAIARLKLSATQNQAQAELDILSTGLRSQLDDPKNWRLKLTPMRESLVGDTQRPLWILLGAVTFVLLIACANVANLLIGRAASRRREIAVRAALGAGRKRVMRQLLTESLLLSVAGGAAGLLVAMWGSALLLALSPKDIPRLTEVGMDWRVALFTFGASLGAGVACGLLPALDSAKIDLIVALKPGQPGRQEGGRARYARNALVTAQVALALTLLLGAGLLLQSFVRLLRIQPGFDAQQVLTFKIHLPEAAYPPLSPQVTGFYRRLRERLRAWPDVKAVSATHLLPLSGDDLGTSVEIEGHSQPGQKHGVGMRIVDRDYFRTLQIPLVSGRDFDDRDGPQLSGKIIVNEEFIRRFLPNADPIGKRVLTLFGRREPREIIGVVRDVRFRSLGAEPQPEMFLPLTQFTFNHLTLVMRCAGPPQRMIGRIQDAVFALDKSLPVYDVKPFDQYITDSVAKPRFNTILLGAFAVVALLLACVGIYGVLAHTVAQRVQEIGVRMALGAQPRDVIKLITAQGMKPVAIGIAIGLMASFTLARVMKSLLYGISPMDPMTYIVISLLLTIIALLSCYLPARRVMKVDPLTALRQE